MRYLVLLAICATFFACSNSTENSGEINDASMVSEESNEKFNDFKNDFVNQLWEIYPGWASHEGNHKYDSILKVPNKAFHNEQLTFFNSSSNKLSEFDLNSLNSTNKTDYYLIDNFLEGSIWSLEEFRTWEWAPNVYNVGRSFATIITGRHADLNTRVTAIASKLKSVPAYYEAAKANINNPTLEHTELAIAQNKGSVSVFGKSFVDSVKKSGVSEDLKSEILKDVELAKESINGYVKFLESEVLPDLKDGNARSFRIGKKAYENKFKYDIESSFTAEELYNKAIKEKENLHAEMAKLSEQLWSDYYGEEQIPEDKLVLIQKVIDTLSENHVAREEFITSIEKQIPELVEFINEKNLLYLDPDKPLVVRETPEYMRGVAGASISAPGPYDKGADTYYNVTPLDDKTEEEAESWLREYNHYILQILNIHEAIPGHYTQLVYSNNSPSIVKSVLGNGAMVEGWAVYTERMMLEEGYGADDPALWLMYYKWNLRTVCNTILDYSVHVLDMSEEDAMDLLASQAFQQTAEAKGKWRRVKLTQVQLTSYFNGYKEIYEFREEYKELMGDKFELKKFHEKFLSYGSAPVKYIRKLMLEEIQEPA